MAVVELVFPFPPEELTLPLASPEPDFPLVDPDEDDLLLADEEFVVFVLGEELVLLLDLLLEDWPDIQELLLFVPLQANIVKIKVCNQDKLSRILLKTEWENYG